MRLYRICNKLYLVIDETKKTRNEIQPQRLKSLDALRGFDMFWIMGAGEFFYTAGLFNRITRSAVVGKPDDTYRMAWFSRI